MWRFQDHREPMSQGGPKGCIALIAWHLVLRLHLYCGSESDEVLGCLNEYNRTINKKFFQREIEHCRFRIDAKGLRKMPERESKQWWNCSRLTM